MTNHWYLWLDGARSPAENMAIDDSLLESMRQPDSQPVLRIYSWSEDAYSIGYFQPYSSAPTGNHLVVRRPSGGGVVDHRNDVTFTLVFPNTSPLFQCDRFVSYHRLNSAVRDGLKSLGIECWLFEGDIPEDHDRTFLVCFQQPARYDVINGRGKLCGGAQRRKLFGMLHQGSILCDQLVDSTRQQISEGLVKAIESAFDVTWQTFQPSAEITAMAERLISERYTNPRWNRKK